MTPTNHAITSLRDLLKMTVFQDEKLEDVLTFVGNIVNGQRLGFIGAMEDVGTKGVGCEPTYKTNKIDASEKQWELGDWDIPLKLCYEDLEGSIAEYTLKAGTEIGDLTSGEYMDYIVLPALEEAMRKMRSKKPDIMVLDLGLPDGDGLDLIRRVRKFSDIPIIVVSARDKEEDKIEALDRGAEDYITKPFSESELMARIRVLRRHLIREERSRMGAEVSVRGLKINFDAKEVTLDGNLLHVTPLEYQLLELLFHNIGKVITTRTLLDELYGVSYGDNTQSLRALMAGLRRKIEKVPGKPQYIVTEIGVGYRLKDE